MHIGSQLISGMLFSADTHSFKREKRLVKGVSRSGKGKGKKGKEKKKCKREGERDLWF